MVFEKAYESSITFQSLLYANVPAESPSYAPTFFQEFEMKWISVKSQDWGRIGGGGGGMCMCVGGGLYTSFRTFFEVKLSLRVNLFL